MKEERKIQKKNTSYWIKLENIQIVDNLLYYLGERDKLIPERKHRFVYGSKLLFMNETKKSETRSFKAPQTVIHFT